MPAGLILVAMMSGAMAGEDPWIAPSKTTNLFMAMTGTRFQEFVSTSDEPMSLDAPIVGIGGKLYLRRGLGNRMDVSLDVPVSANRAPDTDGAGMYESTTGVGNVQLDVRKQWLSSSENGFSSRIAARSGRLHQSSRGRLTNLGEGSTDLGAGLGIGGMSPLGPTFITLDAGGTYWYRFPLSTSSDGSVPADEITWSANAVLTPISAMGVGIATSGLHRLGGQNLGETDVDDPDDRWAALKVQQIKVGGRVALYASDNRPSFSIAFMRAVWAQNNPVDSTLLELGVGWDLGRRSS